MHLPEFGHVLHDRIVERDQAAVAQLQNADRRERLGDRRPVEDRVVVDRQIPRGIAHAVVRARGDGAVLDEGDAAADDGVLRKGRSVSRNESRPSGGGRLRKR